MSWTEASLLAKDSMYKTTRGVTKEMYFTDDGFCVGVAYCLAILKQVRRCASSVWVAADSQYPVFSDTQTRKNEGLHWIDSVKAKLRSDTKEHEVAQEKRCVQRHTACLSLL